MEDEQKQYVRKIEATVNNLRKRGGGMKETTFWEFKRKLESKREEQVTSMKDKDGKIVEKRTRLYKCMKIFLKIFSKLKRATQQKKY